MTPELFISYSRKDEATTFRIYDRLKNAGIEAWIDQKDIPPGVPWDRAVSDAIKSCRAGLVILSSLAVDSLPVRSEFTRILNYGKTLYVVLIDELPRDDFPVLLETIQYVDLTHDFDARLNRLIDQIRTAHEKEITSETRPEEPLTGPQWPPIPQPQHQLMGRNVLKAQIQTQLGPGAVIALHGEDGVGSTALAAALARDLAEQRKRVLWLVVGERDPGWSTLFREIGLVFQVPYLSETDWGDQCKNMRALLTRHAVDLLVLDDVRTSQPLETFVRDLYTTTADPDWPPAPRCALLVTSQQQLAIDHTIEVPLLDDESARQLFRMRAGLSENAALDARFELLENHPLMVEIAARMVSTGRVTLDSLFDRLEETDRMGVHTRRILHVAYAVLDDNERMLLDAFGANWTNTITLSILTAIAHMSDDPRAEAAVNNLAAYLLISRRAQDGPLVPFSMHASSREFVRARLAQQPERYRLLLSSALSTYLAFVIAHSQGQSFYDELDVERENVIKAAEWAAEQGRWKDVRTFAQHLCWEHDHFLNMRGYQTYARKLLSLVHESAREHDPASKETSKLLMRLAMAYGELGDYTDALEQYNKAKQIAETLNDRLLLSQVLGGRALAHHNQSDYRSALADFDRALRLVTERDEEGNPTETAPKAATTSAFAMTNATADANGSPIPENDDKAWNSQRAWVLSYMGVTYADMGYYEIAAMCYYEALRLRQKLGDENGMSVTLGNIGNMLCEQGYYEKALARYQQAYNLAYGLGDQRRLARHIGNLGNVFFHQGEYEKALDKLNEALKIHQEVGDRRRQARRLSQLGNVYRDYSRTKSDYDYATSLYQVSLDLAENLGDKHCQVYTLNGWGLMLVRMARPATDNAPSDFESARKKFEQACNLAEKIENRRGLGNALSNLGTVFVHDSPGTLTSIDQGKDYLEEGLEIAREIGNRRGEVFALIGLGNAYARRFQPGDADLAIRYYHQALAMATEMASHRERVYALNGLGNISMQIGQINEALDYLKTALGVANTIGFLLGKAACLYASSRTWTLYGNTAAAQSDREAAAHIYMELGLTHKAQQCAESAGGDTLDASIMGLLG